MNFTGDDSGRVVIWNVAPIVKEQAEEDENIPKLLCQMDNHLGIALLYKPHKNQHYLIFFLFQHVSTVLDGQILGNTLLLEVMTSL